MTIQIYKKLQRLKLLSSLRHEVHEVGSVSMLKQQVAWQWSWPVIFKICLKTGCPVNFFSYFYLC